MAIIEPKTKNNNMRQRYSETVYCKWDGKIGVYKGMCLETHNLRVIKQAREAARKTYSSSEKTCWTWPLFVNVLLGIDQEKVWGFTSFL